ncbi:MAG: adenosylmethionine--8-amino-7-oxononanoate transaminase [Elusimicrobia bacterium]|nr:adenosylmethionine--8-amino-7-oxononanoate transaminase [Candidatus Obscuribacterium magneticum]
MVSNLTPLQLERWDKKYIWHPFTQHYVWEKEPALIIDSGRGAYLRDVRGRKFLDGVSSLWVNVHGHRNPTLDRAFRRQLSKIAHSTFLGLSHTPAILLAKKLVALAPRGLTRCFYSDNGATAVEIALKMAFQYGVQTSGGRSMKRAEFLALRGSYHGDTLGSVSVGGIETFHSKFKPLLFKAHFAMAPYCYRCPFNRKNVSHRFRLGEKVRHVPRPGERREETGCRWECLADVERILKQRPGKIAGAIIEPVVQGAAGMIVMPPGYVAGFERLCRKHGVLLIVDEVATGFGRTGTLFACTQEGITPDLLCLAKSITGGYSPLAVTLATEKIFRAFYGPPEKSRTFFHGHTYTAHPLGAAVAVANLKLIKSEKLIEKSHHKAHLMKEELEALLELPRVGSIRQAGLMAGIELVRNKKTKEPYPSHWRMGARICKGLLSHGIWLRPLGDTVVLLPPPVISDPDLTRLIRSLRTVILHECAI